MGTTNPNFTNMCHYVDKYESYKNSDPWIINEEMNANKMMCALSAIALEMQKFHANTPISYHNFGENLAMSDKLSLCKSNLRLKRKQIKVLRQNLRKACIVAKTVISAKEKERTFLHNHINSAKSNCIDLYHKNVTNTETIQNLTFKNRGLLDKINILEEFIELGYEELQKMRNISMKDISTVMKLKEIMLSCGQYYADYNNEYNTRLQLEQRNRFLNNKIKILESNLDALTEEVKNVQYQNSKLQKENASLKNKQLKRNLNNSVEIIHYGKPHFDPENNIQMNTMKTDILSEDLSFDLTSHLSLVKNLLSNQDSMLKDLKTLSDKLSVEPIEESKSE